MKKIAKALCFLLVAVLMFSSCEGLMGNTDNNGTTAAPQTEESEAVTQAPADPFPIVTADGKANCTVTVPKDATEEELAVIDDFIYSVKRKTKVELPVVDEASEITTRYEIVVNATQGRDPVKEQWEATPYTDYVIGLWDWHIMVTTRSPEATRAALNTLNAKLEKIEGKGYCLREDLSLQASAMLGTKKTSVPAYDTASGTELPFYSVDDGYEVCITGTTAVEFDAYVKKLGDSGLTKYSENNMASKNLTYVFAGEDLQVFASYNQVQRAARIVFTNPTALPSLTKPTLGAGDTAKVSLAQLGIAGLGMSYVIQLKDYSFIVIDGGTEAGSNVTMLYDYLLEHTPTGQKPTIAAWIFTHCDPDHIGAPYQFLSAHSEDVVLQSVIHNFPDCSVQSTNENDVIKAERIQRLENLLTSFYDATTYVAHTGQIFYFKGVEIEILFTEEDLHPQPITGYNDSSLMARFTFDNGKTFMMLADSTVKTSQLLASTYKEYLKTDMLQLAHHGLIGGDKTLYQYIDPEICFWATSQERFEGTYDTNKDGVVSAKDVQYCLGQGGCDYNKYIRDDTIRKRTHYHAGATVVVMLE